MPRPDKNSTSLVLIARYKVNNAKKIISWALIDLKFICFTFLTSGVAPQR
jgi:hypothetical protein